MKSLLGMFGGLMVYVSLATMITLALLLLYGKSQGYLAPERLAKMFALARGEELPQAINTTNEVAARAAPKPEYDQLVRQSQIRERNLELREEALRNQIKLLESERANLVKDIESFEKRNKDYLQDLLTKEDEETKLGREGTRLILEAVKPKQAKEMMAKMIEKGEIGEVAKIIREMPIARQAKIMAEFKTPEERIQLDEIVRILRVPRELIGNNPNAANENNANSNQALGSG